MVPGPFSRIAEFNQFCQKRKCAYLAMRYLTSRSRLIRPAKPSTEIRRASRNPGHLRLESSGGRWRDGVKVFLEMQSAPVCPQGRVQDRTGALSRHKFLRRRV